MLDCNPKPQKYQANPPLRRGRLVETHDYASPESPTRLAELSLLQNWSLLVGKETHNHASLRIATRLAAIIRWAKKTEKGNIEIDISMPPFINFETKNQPRSEFGISDYLNSIKRHNEGRE